MISDNQYRVLFVAFLGIGLLLTAYNTYQDHKIRTLQIEDLKRKANGNG